MSVKDISVCLWFDGHAEQAVDLYVSLFDDARIGRVMRWGEEGPGTPGSVLTMEFELQGRPFLALNGGPQFRFNEAASMVAHCDTQADIDRLWDALIADGGQPQQCGWLKDRFGLSWQIVPSELPALLQDGDRGRAGRVMAALMQMEKLDIAALRAAHAGA